MIHALVLPMEGALRRLLTLARMAMVDFRVLTLQEEDLELGGTSSPLSTLVMEGTHAQMQAVVVTEIVATLALSLTPV